MIPVDGNEEPSPQLAEDITEVKWADPVFFPEMKKNIYPAIDNLLNLYWK
jgi:hypothetical protein